MTYVKVHGSILDSTIWLEPHHIRIVWMTMLAMKDADGIVGSSIPGLAARARVTLAEVMEALEKFLAPDPFSRTKDFEGRRIEEVDGGWRVLNADKYRDMDDAESIRAKTAARVARHRERKRQEQSGNAGNVTVTLGNAPLREVRHTDTDTDLEAPRDDQDIEPPSPSASEAPVEIANSTMHASLSPPPPRHPCAKYLWPIEQRLAALRMALATEFGLSAPRHPHATTEDHKEALARLQESGPDVEADLELAFAEVEREARDRQQIEFVQWSMFKAGAWRRKMDRRAPIAAPARKAPLVAGRAEVATRAEYEDNRAPWEYTPEEIERGRAEKAAERRRR